MFWATVCKTVRSPSAVRPLSVLSVAMVYCGQTTGWIKMPLGTKVGLGPGDIVFGEDPAPPKLAQPPIFGLCLQWPNGRPSQLRRHTWIAFYGLTKLLLVWI